MVSMHPLVEGFSQGTGPLRSFDSDVVLLRARWRVEHGESSTVLLESAWLCDNRPLSSLKQVVKPYGLIKPSWWISVVVLRGWLATKFSARRALPTVLPVAPMRAMRLGCLS